MEPVFDLRDIDLLARALYKEECFKRAPHDYAQTFLGATRVKKAIRILKSIQEMEEEEK